MLLAIYHENKLCQRCVAQMPLNPSAEVTKYEWHFRFIHRRSTTWLTLIWFAIYIAMLVYAHSVIGNLITIVIFLPILYLGWVHSHHRLLTLWCPWCQRGGWGDGDETVVEPTPDPVGSQKLT